ncbi:MAG: mechanosensitive ion channel domain-containing protein [Methylococcaceae bacterium]|jgi:potassium efflux system protein
MIKFNIAAPSYLNILLRIVVIIALLPNLVNAETISATEKKSSSSSGISHESLKIKIETLNARQDLDAAAKTKILNLYQAIDDNLTSLDNFKNQSIEFKASTQHAPERTKKLQKEIEQYQEKLVSKKQEAFGKIPIEELDQRLILEKEKLSSLDASLSQLENDLTLQNTRPPLIRQRIVSAKQELDSILQKQAVLSNISKTSVETEAQKLLLTSSAERLSAELKMLDIEAISNPVRVEALKAGFQLLTLQKNILVPTITAIESDLSERRQQQARELQDALTQVEKEIADKPKIIQDITRENIQYSQSLQSVNEKIEQYTEIKTAEDKRLNEIEEDYKSAEKKISLAGLSPALGKILREQRRNLPTADQFEQQSKKLQNETALTSLEQFKIEDKLKTLINVDAELSVLMNENVQPEQETDQRMKVQAELRVLLNNQQELLSKLSVADATYIRILGDTDFSRQQLAIQAAKYANFLDERLLWVPSSTPINMSYLAGLYHSTQWLLSPFNWLQLVKDTAKIALRSLWLLILALSTLWMMLLVKKWARQELAGIAEHVGKLHTDSFFYTVKALLYTLLKILPIPLFIFYVGWFLNHDSDVSDFTQAIGAGLRDTAVPFLVLQFLFLLFAENGIAVKHFQWKKATAQIIRKPIAWIRFISIPNIFIIGASSASHISAHSDNIGRLALIFLMLAVTLFLGIILKPSTGLLQHHINNNPEKWLVKLRYVWYLGILALPLTIIGFAVAGYYLSALELQQKFIISLRLFFLLTIAHQLVIRWLNLVNRQLALTNAKQMRKANAPQSSKHASGSSEDPIIPLDEKLIDIPKINAQTIKLLNLCIGFGLIIGLWLTWDNILPAFSFLDEIVLWKHAAIVDNQEIQQPVTLTNLMLSGLYVFVTVIAVRNFSGLMELLLFRRIDIEHGSRYAINQLSQYLLITIGFISVANELGGSWSQVQWLVAALGVGLGFGLQEIFANLVSGIILLFERPIRVGDTVTIGDVSGKVSRIQMRATTLIDWDQKELIVPNKNFITSQLVNWTLSDAITRVVIPIGIAYGSDIEMAQKVMMDTVKATPMVLTDPEPRVLFLGFGDSSLNFTIHIYVSELGNRLPTTHDLHFRLEKAFREHKIEIPFPQRDIHIRKVKSDNE